MDARMAFATLAFAIGCGDTFISTDSDGRLEVVISSSGTGADEDGFSITVDGGTSVILAQGGRATLTGLGPGSHSVLLGGLAENCAVLGANPRTVAVGADGTAAVTFDIYCERATTVSSPSRCAPPASPPTPMATCSSWARAASGRSAAAPARPLPGCHRVCTW
jgi:hypothetical protein